MKLFPILAVSVGATSVSSTTTFDDAIALLKARYNDLKLRRVDNSEHLLKKTTRKMARTMRRMKTRMQNRGCLVNNLPYDFSLDIKKKCNIAQTLKLDAEAASYFFSASSSEYCRRFQRSFVPRYYDKYVEYFDGQEVTCEVKPIIIRL